MKIALNVVLFLLELMLTLGILLYAYRTVTNTSEKFFNYGKQAAQSSTKDRPYEEVEVTIAKDATTQEIASVLYDNGLISNALLFTLETKLNGTADLFYSGTYQFNTHMETSEILDVLTTAPIIYADGISITINEGYTQKQIGEYLESKGIVTAEEFQEACSEAKYNYSFLTDIPEREYFLEGYLFPDTYYITENATAEEIVDKLLSQFNKVYSLEYKMRAEELGLTTDEVITIASIIEKEIQLDTERAKASAVIYNRLDKKMALGMCSTVLYALGKRKDRLLDEDLQIKSPYNTYINAGLPVGPIANPGEACIVAALYPDNVNYIYFVLKGDDSTEHFFTNDVNEFLNAKALYQQRF